jgi:hydrogenase maturation protease
MDDQLTKNNTNKCFGDIQSRPKLLLFGYGNPGRGDDALGPMLVEHIAELKLDQVTCLNDMQLLVEHATDLVGFERVIFVDADMSCRAPYVMSEVSAKKDDSYTSHALSPAALLYIYQQAYGHESPPASILHIRGYDFALGDALSDKASANLQAAIQHIKHHYEINS